MLEVEIPAGNAGQSQRVASVDLNYFNTVTQRVNKLYGEALVSYTESKQMVAKATDNAVMADTVKQIANEISKEAVLLRDSGRVQEARDKLEEGASYLHKNAQQLNAPALQSLSTEFEQDAAEVDDEATWNRTRKLLKKKQHSVDTQQRY